MKQQITVEQLNELSDDARDRLCKWCETNGYDWRIVGYNTMPLQMVEPLLSIGQMIQFLKGKQVYDFKNRPYTFVQIFWSDLRTEWVVRFDDEEGGSCMEYEDHEELCDALWKAVKEVLEK